jgi:exopolyphosphatase/guanosine-5'-triphosphate,3'-diphosphate pyrophosphatase
MHITTVDIGTNTVLTLTVECHRDGRVERLGDAMEIPRLGEGLDRSGRLAEPAMRRTLEALERTGRLIVAQRPDHVAAVATEAVRKADNAGEFLERARAALGHPIDVIDGEREAHLSWLATSRSLPPSPTGRRTIVDIGGGSTELIVGTEKLIERSISIPIGSVRLTERLLHHDPPTADERRALVETTDRALAGAPTPEGDLVGIAGTVTTVCAIHLGLARYDADHVHGARLQRADVDAVVDRIAALDAEGRRGVRGLDPKRADVILAGAIILSRVIARAGVDELMVSDRGVRWGLAYEIAERELGIRCH